MLAFECLTPMWETGLYCLGSRYYDPEVGRFVNADDTDVIFAKPQELGSKNLYAYCDNNPVVKEDYEGEFPFPIASIVGAAVGAVVSGFSYVLTSGGEIDGVELAKSCLVGAVSGALAPLKGGFLMAAAIVNGINTVINTEGDPVTRVVYGIIEGGATYIAGNWANKVTDMVQFGSKAAEALGNAAVNYSIGQPMELAATGVSAAAKPVTKAIAKNMGIATSNAGTPKQSNTRVITTVSGRKKVIHKVKKPTRRNTKFQRVCMA